MERRFSKPRFGEKRFDRGFDGDFEKPVNEGETYDVEIKEVGSKGDGIARVKNFVIFVPDAKQGEKCKIKITQVSRRFAIAEKVGKGAAKEVEEAKEEETEEEVSEEPAETEAKKKTEEEVSEEPAETEAKKKTKEEVSEEVEESEGEEVEDK